MNYNKLEGMKSTIIKTARMNDERRVRGIRDETAVLGEKKRYMFKQADVFKLRANGLLPMGESIMTLKQYVDARSSREGVYDGLGLKPKESEDRCEINLFRTLEYGVYRRDFDRNFDMTVGTKVVWIEKGLDYSFIIPDVPHPTEKSKSLSEATGLVVFDMEDLVFDEGNRIVKAKSDFDHKQVRVVDVMRPTDFAFTDESCYPLRGKPATGKDVSKGAVYSGVSPDEDFESTSNGWHGSIVFALYRYYGQTVTPAWISYVTDWSFVIGSEWSEQMEIAAIKEKAA